MIYNADNKLDVFKAHNDLKLLIANKSVFRITRVYKKRSYAQNRYLYLILTYFANQYGETIDYVKQYFFKELVNPDIFKTSYTNTRTKETRIAWRSTADLDSKELTTAIDKFRHYSAQKANIYLPAREDIELLNSLEIENEKYKMY